MGLVWGLNMEFRDCDHAYYRPPSPEAPLRPQNIVTKCFTVANKQQCTKIDNSKIITLMDKNYNIKQ